MVDVKLTKVEVVQNAAPFTSAYEFVISFVCAKQLNDDLEWDLIYVGSSESEQYDQKLTSVLVGPVKVGVNKFILKADAPNPALIPRDDLIGVTVIMITCSYKKQEFVRVGFYINNEWQGEEEAPSVITDYSKISRNILISKPRITNFTIDWNL
eukprot:TRINITY_DN11823_c0_g1_i1.p1 TRINITY_DN11823_c0_g1~~TRINITY_DN11823_c0_g1_i1.p1  ORF type:complete len:154 (+),score=16.42 TRINITY_DN11823_c0_g1_i1:73-534(+)